MNSKEQTKIMIVDDHVLLRDALASLINTFPDFKVIGAASNGEEMIMLFKNSSNPDIVIMDLNMPGMDGYKSTEWLQKNHPDIKIVILTMFDSEIALIRLLRVGVRGFMKKDINPGELKNALQSIAKDGYYYSNNATSKLASFIHKSHLSHFSLDKALLTEQEIEFLKLASSELTYKEIAQTMHLTPRAIDGYRDGLFDKLDVKSRVGLAIYAVKHGIVSF